MGTPSGGDVTPPSRSSGADPLSFSAEPGARAGPLGRSLLGHPHALRSKEAVGLQFRRLTCPHDGGRKLPERGPSLRGGSGKGHQRGDFHRCPEAGGQQFALGNVIPTPPRVETIKFGEVPQGVDLATGCQAASL